MTTPNKKQTNRISIEGFAGISPIQDWLAVSRQSVEAFDPLFQNRPGLDIDELVREMREERSEELDDVCFGRPGCV